MEVVGVINHSKICNLIYSQKTKKACAMALDLLSEPATGLDEALQYLYMRDAYYRLGEKEKVKKYGCLAKQCAKKYFHGRNIFDMNNLYNQSVVIRDELENIGICDIEIEIFIKEEIDRFRIILYREEFYKDILISDLEKELNLKIKNRIRDERYFYYREAADEIVKNIKEIVSPNLYGEVLISISRSV